MTIKVLYGCLWIFLLLLHLTDAYDTQTARIAANHNSTRLRGKMSEDPSVRMTPSFVAAASEAKEAKARKLQNPNDTLMMMVLQLSVHAKNPLELGSKDQDDLEQVLQNVFEKVLRQRQESPTLCNVAATVTILSQDFEEPTMNPETGKTPKHGDLTLRLDITLLTTAMADAECPASTEQDVVTTLEESSDDLTEEWVDFGWTKLVRVEQLASEAPSIVPSAAPMSPSSTPSSEPTTFIEELGFYHTTYAADLQLELYGAGYTTDTIPRNLIGPVEDVIADFINDYHAPIDLVAFQVSGVELVAATTTTATQATTAVEQPGIRRLNNGNTMTLSCRILGEGISTDEDALMNVDKNTVVESGFLSDYPIFLERLRELGFPFDSILDVNPIEGTVSFPTVESQDDGGSTTDSRSRVLVLVAAALGAIMLAMMLLVLTYFYLNKRNAHLDESYDESEEDDGPKKSHSDDTTTKPASEVEVQQHSPDSVRRHRDAKADEAVELDESGSVLYENSDDIWSCVSSMAGDQEHTAGRPNIRRLRHENDHVSRSLDFVSTPSDEVDRNRWVEDEDEGGAIHLTLSMEELDNFEESIIANLSK